MGEQPRFLAGFADDDLRLVFADTFTTGALPNGRATDTLLRFMKLEKDTTISHYKILSEIGKGGMGEVYLAQDTELDRKVAIKLLGEEFSQDSDKLNRFVREAKSASALNQPNIITIYEIGEWQGLRYIVLEYIDGETLTKRLRKKLKFNTALEIATQIASALDAAHSGGIVHRDIKPDNVMVRKDGLVKILDFGIAKLTETRRGDTEKGRPGEGDKTLIAVSPRPSVSASPNTTPGMIIGTANYMSPEQAAGKAIDARTDIFSFGVVLYEIISGDLPFEGETPMEIIAAIINKEPKPLDSNIVPPEIERIISKSLRKDRNERYQTIKGLLADLKEVKQELEFQDKLEKTVSPDRKEPETQMFKATTVDESNQTTTNENLHDSITIKKSGIGKAAIGIFAVLLISAIGLGYWFYSGNSSRQIESIAVMPFVNESGNEDVEYLSDGMTESLISSLSNIPNVSVKARSTVFFYKGKNVSPEQIGEELGVQAILLGRFVQRGDDLKLSLELVNTQTQDVIWSDQFDRKMSDLVAVQREIAQQVAAKISSRLTGDDRKKVEKVYTNNPEAYQAYLKGRFYWNQRTSEGFNKGIEYFQKAIQMDPGYALAWSGLADSYFLLPEYGAYSPLEYLPKAKKAALKAVELDPHLAEAQCSLAYIEHVYDWKFSQAEERYKKAIELNSNYATAYQWYSELLVHERRFDKAQQMAKKSVELDPLSLIKNNGYAQTYFYAKQYVEAEKLFRKVLEIAGEFSVANRNLAKCLVARGNIQDALNESDKAYRAGGESFRLSKGLIYAAAGDKKNAERFTSAYDGLDPRQVWDLTLIYSYLGDEAKALDGVEKMVKGRSVFVLYANADPGLDKVRDNPRFKELMKQIGFAE